MTGRELPPRHLSVRVPWHDTAYDGRICADPLANGACLRLLRISAERDDRREVENAGRAWIDLDDGDLPPCSAERAGFMSPKLRSAVKNHPYAAWNDTYRKFGATPYEIPAFAADCVPFRWMLRENAAQIAEQFQIPYEADLEQAVDQEAGLRDPAWVQHAANQRALLDTFFSAIKPQKSLIFVYAKESPMSADPRRILVGVGRVESVASVIPYVQSGAGFGSVLWERVVRHTMRPSMEDGFVLPYQEVVRLADEDSTIDLEDFAVFVPDEFSDQFSYASEHVSHDAALDLLLGLERAVDRFTEHVSGNWDVVRQWLSARVEEVWEARGPCPGLAAALCAFGVTEGAVLAFAAESKLADNENPWPIVDGWLRDPSSGPVVANRISKTVSQTWTKLPEGRRDLLKLLSRFTLTGDQATRLYQETERLKAGIDVTDGDLLANPYLVYERGRLCADPVSIGTADRGVFPDERVRLAHPLPEPSRVDDPLDPRRVRGIMVDVLEAAAIAGDALRAQDRVIQQIRDGALQPPCPMSNDAMVVISEHLPPEIELSAMADGKPALQLSCLVEVKKAIAKLVTKRRRGRALAVSADWRQVIDEQLDGSAADDLEEELARQEKAAALKVLATSRISVLIGAAGTGKTTLLRALCSLDAVSDGGVLLLAPTGKARVRMQEAIGQSRDSRALTIAQLLVVSDRYDPVTSRYRRSDRDRFGSARTVIVDECSMLTEDALDALLDGLEGYDRLILAGDPRQLPPIGVGRPFVDVVNHLRDEGGEFTFPRVAQSYAELTIPRRQVGTGNGDDDRADLQLAEWFGGGETGPGADEVWDRLRRGEDLGTVRLRKWDTVGEVNELLCDVLASELSAMSDPDDADGFQTSYGGSVVGAYVYFNLGAANAAENWQVLSPVRATGGGVNELNRTLQRTYRAEALALARLRGWKQKIPKAAGTQEVVYGDKVINIRNRRRRHYFPDPGGVLEYVANGEIGVVTGPFRRKGAKAPLDRLEVEFSTQTGTAYKFWLAEMGGDEGTPPLELAYAITVHKSQGSEFGRTFVVVPNPCRLLSRELLYTALTRQREHVTVLYQGDISDLQEYSKATYSEAAARVTNLFRAPDTVELDGRYLEAGLIHKTRKGLAVRSKSEVIIADLLFSKGIDFEYEKPLEIDGERKLPDFTIADSDSGVTYYWEHLGMLQRPSYRRKWESKKAWYSAHGIVDESSGGGEQGTLITTRDGDDGSISSAAIENLIDRVLS